MVGVSVFEILSPTSYLLLVSDCSVKVILCGSYPVLKYIKIICDITLHGKGSIMSRMTNAPYSPACAQPSDPSDALSILVAPLCT